MQHYLIEFHRFHGPITLLSLKWFPLRYGWWHYYLFLQRHVYCLPNVRRNQKDLFIFAITRRLSVIILLWASTTKWAYNGGIHFEGWSRTYRWLELLLFYQNVKKLLIYLIFGSNLLQYLYQLIFRRNIDCSWSQLCLLMRASTSRLSEWSISFWYSQSWISRWYIALLTGYMIKHTALQVLYYNRFLLYGPFLFFNEIP